VKVTKTALVLSGGGARAAYQVGVLKAIAEIAPACRGGQQGIPFPIICGTSSGAINAAMMASHADHFARGVQKLEQLWGNLRSDQIHRVGYRELMGSTLKLFGSFFRSGIAHGRPLSLFNNTPLNHLLIENIDLQFLPAHIKAGHLHALCITALGYQTGRSISFFQGDDNAKPWQRRRRTGVRSAITHKHLMASAALPAIFPAVRINQEYFGDGAIRQTAPMSAALHLGADRLMVIGVSGSRYATEYRVDTSESLSPSNSPSIAQIFAQLLNSAFIDSLEEDLDMLQRFNRFIAEMDEIKRQQIGMRPVEVLVISPSVKFDELAANHIRELPKAMRVFLKTIGATRRGGGPSLASYLLFESGYCSELMRYGYQDCMAQSENVAAFLSG
jgi:NTE family protein